MPRIPRMPSQSQMRSQMRSAANRAERQYKAEVQKAARKFESDVQSAVRRSERESRNQVRLAANSQPRRTLSYTTTEQTSIDRWLEAAEDGRQQPAPNDLFLSHAWPDRSSSAKELYNELTDFGLAVWFSEVELKLGVSLARQLDKALANCKAGLVLVTPAFLTAVETGTWAEKELGVLLNSERVIPVLHDLTFEDVRRVSPFLAERAGLSTQENTFREIAEKIAANF